MSGIMKSLAECGKKSFNLIRNHPAVMLPFFLLAIMEGISLSIWYYAPRPPLSAVLSPLIKAFAGEQFLHYPLNFLILPRLLFISRLMVYFSFGLMAAGMTVCSVYQIEVEKRTVGFWGNFNRAVRRYLSLLALGLIYALFSLLIYKVPRIIIARFFIASPFAGYLFAVVFFVSFVGMVFCEGLSIYAVAYMVILRQGIFAGYKKGFLFFKKNFITVFLLLLFFRAFNAGLIIIKNKLPVLIKEFFPVFPEITLFVLGTEIAVLFLANFFIALLACELLVVKKDEL